MPFSIIVALDQDLGIGKNGTIPWNLKGDMRHFKEITTFTKSKSKVNAVIMGRKTWESLPEKFRPLPGRLNIVLTHNKSYVLPQGVLRMESLGLSLQALKKETLSEKLENTFVIGGGEIFKEAIAHSSCTCIYLTQILSSFSCDIFFPAFKERFKESSRSPQALEDSISYYFAEYTRI